MDVQELYAQALEAVDARHWAEARDLLQQVLQMEAGYRDTAELLELAERLALAEQAIAERRAATERELAREDAADEKVRGPAWVGPALFLGAIGLVATLLNLLLQNAK